MKVIFFKPLKFMSERSVDTVVRQLVKKGIFVNTGEEVASINHFSGDVLELFPKEVYLGSAKGTIGLGTLGNLDYLKSQGFKIWGWEQYNERYSKR